MLPSRRSRSSQLAIHTTVFSRGAVAVCAAPLAEQQPAHVVRSEPKRDLTQFRCFDCETKFFEEWPPAGVSGWDDIDFYRKCWASARDRFMLSGRFCDWCNSRWKSGPLAFLKDGHSSCSFITNVIGLEWFS